MLRAGRPGWVLELAAIGLDGTNVPADYTAQANAGLGVIVRINHGYGSTGTIPTRDQYPAFAQACARFVARSRGCRIWIIGNEPNHADERPNGQPILPYDYARAYTLCRAAIKAVPGHEDDEVLVAGPAPWNATTTYPGNEKGDWVLYFVHTMMALPLDGCDGFSIHTYTHDLDPNQITGDFFHTAPGYQHLRNEFRTYLDFMNAIPDHFRHLPVFITETDPTTRGQGWNPGNNVGWVRAAYGEIADWNGDPAHQPILALILYRWPSVPDQPEWSINNRPGIIEDFVQAMEAQPEAACRVRMPAEVESPVVPVPSNPLPIEARWPGQVTASLGLNLRSGPSTDHAILQVLPDETRVYVLAELDDWLYVSTLGKLGYVHGAFVLRNWLQSAPQPPRTLLRNSPELFTQPLAPPSGERFVLEPDTTTWTEEAVVATWNRFGALTTTLAGMLELDLSAAVAALAVQSSGRAFADDGRMPIRFENHSFFHEWGKLDPELFSRHFRFDLTAHWRGHEWRPAVDQAWRSFHGDHNAEWQVFNFARDRFDERAALRSISMGVPQIMGFDHELLGYAAVCDLFEAFASSAHAQVIGFFDFVSADPARLDALRSGDFLSFASTYKGVGQAPLYATLMTDAANVFDRLHADQGQVASDDAAQLPLPQVNTQLAKSDPELYAAWRKHILDGFAHNNEMFDRLVRAFMGPYHTTVLMYRILFGLGLVAFVVAVALSLWTGEAMFALVFGGLGAAAFLSYFLSRPLRSLEENLNFITWLGVIYNTYWTRLVYAMNQETVQQDLAAATDDFVRQIEQLLDKHAELSEKRPDLR